MDNTSMCMNNYLSYLPLAQDSFLLLTLESTLSFCTGSHRYTVFMSRYTGPSDLTSDF